MGEAKRKRALKAQAGAMHWYRPRDASLLPGYEKRPDGRGYSFDSPTGRCSFIGADILDQVFHSERYGLLNVSEALRQIMRAGATPVRTHINPNLIHHIRLVEINETYVRDMPEARRDEPILMLVASDGVNTIDGHHRLTRRIRDKLEFVETYLMHPQNLWPMQVRLERQMPNGVWLEEQIVSKATLEKEVAGGIEQWKRLYEMNGIKA